MTRLSLTVILLALSAAMNAVGVAHESGANTPETADQHNWRQPSNRELAEDMEIFGAILQENLVQAYRGAAGAYRGATGAQTDIWPHAPRWNTAFQRADSEAGTISDPLFEYLPGYGVVLNIRISTLRPELSKSAQPPENASRWDQTRRRLTGEANDGVTTDQQCGRCHQADSLKATGFSQQDYYLFNQNFNHADAMGSAAVERWILRGSAATPTASAIIQTVIETLAEHGHRLRGLRPSERVTISLSYWQNSTIGTAGERPNSDEADESQATERAPQDGSAASKRDAGKRNPIDAFVLEHLGDLDKEPREDGEALLRRVFREVAGRPPTPEEVEASLEDGSADAYRRFLARMLNSPVGEKQLEGATARNRSAPFPARSRISVSATAQQLTDVATGATESLEFSRKVELRMFRAR